MTERAARHVQRRAREFAIGPSRVAWDGASLIIDVDERSVPLPRRVRGQLRVHPEGLSQFAFALDVAGAHRWGPIAPSARIEVDLQQPVLRWRGHAYIDSNEGDELIERAFTRWDWLRAHLDDGGCMVMYDTLSHEGARRGVGVRFQSDGQAAESVALGQQARLASTPVWRIDRRVPLLAPGAEPSSVRRTFEDTPFYARSLLSLPLGGPRVEAVHETLDVTRLRMPIVQRMLPWRMPRTR